MDYWNGILNTFFASTFSLVYIFSPEANWPFQNIYLLAEGWEVILWDKYILIRWFNNNFFISEYKK